MSRYIDTDKTLTQLEDLFDTNYWGNTHLIDKVMTVVYNQPTADVVPVVHAQWVPKESILHVEMSGACSNCGEAWCMSDTKYFNFCPNCGAKMDEEDNQ